jgi:transcriptional/translational regulatory protein YebC/TACO1
VRHAFSKHGGNLGTDGSVAYLFSQRGILTFAPGVDEDALMEAALEAGAEDILTDEDGSADVYTTPDAFLDVKEALEQAGFTADNAEVTYQASTEAELQQEDAERLVKLVDMLEDLDDVQQVYSNASISAEIMESLD